MALDAINHNTTCQKLQVQLPQYEDLHGINMKWKELLTSFGLMNGEWICCSIGWVATSN